MVNEERAAAHARIAVLGPPTGLALDPKAAIRNQIALRHDAEVIRNLFVAVSGKVQRRVADGQRNRIICRAGQY
jgi:hypothetical protein